MESAVEVRSLVRRFGVLTAVDNLSFTVRPGEIFGLIGPNGSGKTTTLRVVATLLLPSSGTVEVFGHDVIREAGAVRRLISYLPEDAGAYKNLSGLEYLRFMATFYSGDTVERDRLVERGMEIAGLGTRIKDRVRTYSKGMARKLLLARALMTAPKLAILDEPTSGLDVENATEVRKIIRDFARSGTTVLLSSHNMLEVEFLSDRVGIIRQGRLIATGSPAELKAEFRAENLEQVFLRAAG
ncbi:MAG: ABC transporter ATP-binding protein [candidate division WOR-3 bacterium]|uniref:ABC transporter ATP-binding protein n=1 Tax=candidate division WOR-3 bacterium TaxID=2052148 RepID=A0A7C1N9W7_UNCW3|nr:ABC transporter ATP-binding protein [candidate division WOR-3 bacterium]